MAIRRRLTINPPLTEAEFARFCAANPGLEIDRDPSGVIVMSPKRKCRDDYVDWLLSQRGTVSTDIDLDDDGPSIGAEFHRTAQDKESIQALKGLRDRRPGTKVEARVNADSGELWHEGRRIARHERCYSRQQQVLDLEHYLDVLERKPGALAGSAALVQWRQAGRWPESFDRLWQALNTRHGRQHGTRQMIELLQLGAGDGWSQLRSAVEQALALGCHDVAAIRHLMLAGRLDRPTVAAVDVGPLARYERPMPVMNSYDQLLSHAVEVTA